MTIEHLLITVLALLVLFMTWAWWRARRRTRRDNLRRLGRAQRGESEADRVLEAAGFRVLDHQVTARWTLWIDGDPREVYCRADCVVEAHGHPHFPNGTRFVADVKTGERAPDPATPSTRRQLLEYRLAFETEGLLIVDMERRRVLHVELPEA